MPEFLRPDVYTVEAPSGVTTPPGVSAANAGFVGFSPRGAVNVASLVTSFDQYVKEWGGFTALSNVAQHIYAFFANGGRRAYFVRQVGAGAVKSSGFLQNLVEEEVIDTGDGLLVAFGGKLGNAPIRNVATGGNITITYNIDDAQVVGEACDMSPDPDGVNTSFAGKLGLLGVDTKIVPGSVTITDTTALAGEVYTDTAADGILLDTAGPTARGFVDYETGHFTLTVLAPAVPGAPGDVTYNYTARMPGAGITDDGAGVLVETGTGAVGVINYTTGVWSIASPPAAFVMAAPPSLQDPLLATYVQDNVAAELLWEGTGGNNIRVVVEGDPNYYTRSTGTYTRGVLKVYELDASSVYQLKEKFEALSFSTVTDLKYLLSIVNNVETGSKLISVAAPTDLELPQSLLSLQRARAVSAGNGVATQFGSSGATPTIANPFVTDPLETTVQPGSISITYVDSIGTNRTITDDGNGNLIGDVDPAAAAGFNEVDYDTGEFAFQVVAVPGTYAVAAADPLINIVYYLEPTSTSVSDDMAGGNNGILPLTRTELTDGTTMKAAREGVYAFLKVNENLNLSIPESAGDTDMLGDLLDEAKLNGMWFIVCATAAGLTPLQAQQWRRFTWAYSQGYGALYYPWIMVNDPVSKVPTAMPPLGHIAGIYARTVALQNVGGIPAGIIRATLSWLRGFERKLEDGEIDILDPYQINCLRDTAEVPKVVWGANTLEQPPSDFQYIHARMLVNHIRLALFRGGHPFCFEDSGAGLWARVRGYAEGYLGQKYKDKWFAGNKPSDAYFVTCDASNNDPDSEYVYCRVGIRPKKVAKFIVFEIQLKTGTY